MSGLDWFPTFVAAAGNPNIVDELKKGKQLGDTTYKVHLDGYNQMDLITGKGPSKRHEIFYFTESTLGAVRIDDYKYRFTDQPNGWLGGTVKVDWPILVNLRLDPFERTGMSNGDRVARLLQLVRLRVLAFRLRAAGSGEGSPRPSSSSRRCKGAPASTWKRSRRRSKRRSRRTPGSEGWRSSSRRRLFGPFPTLPEQSREAIPYSSRVPLCLRSLAGCVNPSGRSVERIKTVR